jgi:hypothetical protein
MVNFFRLIKELNMSDVEGDDAPAAAAAAPVVASSGPMGIDAAIQVIINIQINFFCEIPFDHYSCRDITDHLLGDPKNMFYKIQDTKRKDIEVTKAATKYSLDLEVFIKEGKNGPQEREETKNFQALTSVLRGFLLSLDVLKYTGFCYNFFPLRHWSEISHKPCGVLSPVFRIRFRWTCYLFAPWIEIRILTMYQRFEEI